MKDNKILDKYLIILSIIFVCVFLSLIFIPSKIFAASWIDNWGSFILNSTFDSCDECLEACSAKDNPSTCAIAGCLFSGDVGFKEPCKCEEIIAKGKDFKDRELIEEGVDSEDFITNFYNEDNQLATNNYDCILSYQNEVRDYVGDSNPQNSSNVDTGLVIGGFGCDESDESCSDINATQYVSCLFAFITFILGGIAVLKIIIAGFIFSTSAGDGKAISDAKNHLYYAIVGIVLIVLANFLLYLFGVDPIPKCFDFGG